MLYEVITTFKSGCFCISNLFYKCRSQVISEPYLFDRMGIGRDRITSYNVCYTKLLRALANTFKIPSVFVLLIGSYTVYTYVPMAVPIDLKLCYVHNMRCENL